MARDFQIPGESLVLVKGAADSGIAVLSELGLADSSIHVRPNFVHQDINVDAWGPRIPADVQWFLSDVTINMTLVHYDNLILDICVQQSMASTGQFGTMGRAGQRMGNNTPRFGAGNRLVSLNITSPVLGQPWRFFFCYLSSPPVEFPLGTQRSLIVMNWRAIPFTQDPYGGGTGALGYPLWDNVLDD